MKTIIHFPVVHHPKYQLERGYRRAGVSFNYDTDLPLREELESALNGHWSALDAETKNRIIEKMYIDSLHERMDFNEFLSGMRNADMPFYNAIKNFLERGACPVKTEDYSAFSRWDLSVEERTRIRDEAIAKNVRDTLIEGNTGILLLGDSHSADDMIEKESGGITVKRIDGRITELREILDEQYRTLKSRYGIS